MSRATSEVTAPRLTARSSQSNLLSLRSVSTTILNLQARLHDHARRTPTVHPGERSMDSFSSFPQFPHPPSALIASLTNFCCLSCMTQWSRLGYCQDTGGRCFFTGSCSAPGTYVSDCYSASCKSALVAGAALCPFQSTFIPSLLHAFPQEQTPFTSSAGIHLLHGNSDQADVALLLTLSSALSSFPLRIPSHCGLLGC